MSVYLHACIIIFYIYISVNQYPYAGSFAVMKNGIVTVTTETEGTRGIGSARAVKRKSVTERGGTERKKREDTSHHGGIK